jgi:pimeloyl-ACP methyl ester carboxylesterase
MPELIAADTIVRNESAKTTTYNIVLPWREFGVSAGAAPTIGLTVARRSRGDDKVVSYEWGRWLDDGSRPELFHRLYLANPPGPANSTIVLGNFISGDSRSGELRLTTADRGPLVIEAGLQGQTRTYHAPPAKADEPPLRRFTVRGYPGLPLEQPMILTAHITADDKTLTAGKVTLCRPADIVDKLQRRLDGLIDETSKNKLFARHLRSLKAVVAAKWASDVLSFGQDSAEARQTVAHCKILQDELDGPAGRWQTYLDRRLPLCLAFTSRIDDTVQFYKVLLPPNWDPDKTYPLIVQLHGAGDPDPIYFWGKLLIDGPSLPAKDPYIPEAYVIMPWCHGNHHYRGGNEKNVFEAMADATGQFKIDPDRVYLWGHSMGGGGTWSIALRYPDRFAAVGISAGGNWNLPWTGLGGNVDGLPFRIWHGLSDTEVSPAYTGKMEKELKKYGQNVTVVRTAGATHNDGWSFGPVMEKWLMQYTRKRPDHFAYLADTAERGGRNGVTMAWEPTLSVAPHFVCDIQGNEVRLTVTGTPEVTVVLGPGQLAADGQTILPGLGLKGMATVILNGKQVFYGPVPAKPLKFAVP